MPFRDIVNLVVGLKANKFRPLGLISLKMTSMLANNQRLIWPNYFKPNMLRIDLSLSVF